MKDALLDLEDDLSRVDNLLMLLLMATDGLIKEERAAMYDGLALVRDRTADIGERLRALREDAGA